MKNVVLIGMPTSGKTTVGKLLAARLRRAFYDVDELFTARYVMTPRQCIERFGEERFRELESGIVLSLENAEGIVIATGGGSVLRGENVASLRKNGVLFWLDRPVSLLIVSQERPLSATREALQGLFEQRKDIYERVCHHRIDASGDPEGTAERIIKLYESGI